MEKKSIKTVEKKQLKTVEKKQLKTIKDLRKQLKLIIENSDDQEECHILLDDALLNYIDNKEVSEIFTTADIWYA